MTVSPKRTFRASVDTYRGVRVIQTPQFAVPQRFAASGFCPVDSLYRCLMVGTSRFDVVFVSDHLPNVSLPFFASKLLKPETIFVADWADLFTAGGLHEHWNRSIAVPVYRVSRALERGVKRCADLCTATSRPLLSLLRGQLQIPEWRSLHLPSGADSQITFPPTKSQSRRDKGLPSEPLIVGRTCSGDRITPTEINSMIALAERYRSLTQQDLLFYLIGPCDPKKYPKLFASRCKIRFTGKLVAAELPAHLAACDVFLLIEDDEVNCHYRGPIRLNDYLAAGRPVVCNSIGDHVRTLSECAACVVCDDFLAPNAALDEVLTSPAVCDAMGRNARTLAVTSLSWERLGRRLESFILQYAAVLRSQVEPLPALLDSKESGGISPPWAATA